MSGLRLVQFTRDLRDEPRVPGEPQHEVHVVGLAPAHQLVAAEPAVGANDDPRRGPTLAQLGYDARYLFHATGRRVDVGGPQLRRQKMPIPEHEQRQVAVAVVIAVEEAALLVAV